MFASAAADAILNSAFIFSIFNILFPGVFAQAVYVMICIKLKNPGNIYAGRTWLTIRAARTV